MIALQEVAKRYLVDEEPGEWVLRGVNFEIPPGARVGVIGDKAAGKSTLLRLISGVEEPTTGRILRRARVSHPARFLRNLQPLLSGRQNARFICRVSGTESGFEDRLARVEQIARLGAAFDNPLKTYTAQMKGRLSFALSWSVDFDFYVADAYNFSGPGAFGDAQLAAEELAQLPQEAGLVLSASGAKAAGALEQLCRSGIAVGNAQAIWHDSFHAAVAALRAGDQGSVANGDAAEAASSAAPAAMASLERIRRLQSALQQLKRGLSGQTYETELRQVPSIVELGRQIGLDLVSRDQLHERNAAILPGAVPVLRGRRGGAEAVDYFDLNSQSLTGSGPATQT